MSKQIVQFQSGGVALTAALFMPSNSPLKNNKGIPCVVMAHGLGGTRAAGLEPYAERFCTAGLAVLCFDYRGFGESAGEPRQVVSVRKQLDDWAAAIAFAREQESIDQTRIATWGSSFSGAHSVTAAVEDGRIAAVSAQGAMMDGLASLKFLIKNEGIGRVSRVTGFAIVDAVKGVFGMPRVMLPVVEEPGKVGVLTSPGAKSGYLALTPPDWRNEISTSWMLKLALYRPNRKVNDLPCPALFCVATEDNIVPPSAMEDAARRGRDNIIVKRYPVGHFEIYIGDGFEQSSKDQTEFFVSTLQK